LDVIGTRDIELAAAYILKAFRKAAREAVLGRLSAHDPQHTQEHPRTGALGRIADGLTQAWDLTEAEEIALLGLADAAALIDLRPLPPEQASAETIERLSMLVDIYQALHTLLPEAAAANSWLKAANSAPMFDGSSALHVMMAGGVSKIREVRSYLWSQIHST
jgi:hypothetical protein